MRRFASPHHILLANRYWLLLALQREFAREEESRIPEGLDSQIERFKETAIVEMDWIFQLPESDLLRQLRSTSLPARSFSVARQSCRCACTAMDIAHSAQPASGLSAALRPYGLYRLAGSETHPDWPVRS